MASVSRSRRSVGRPRSENARQAIFAAVLDLLETNSVRELTIESIAKKAGVGKVTIYRWWPTKTRLIIDAFIELMAPQTSNPKPASTFGDLTTHFAAVVEEYRGKIGRIIAEIIAEGQFDRDSLEYFLEQAISKRRKFATKAVETAKESNEITSEFDTDVIIDALYGPLYFRLLVGHKPIDEDFTRQIIALVSTMIRSGDQPDAIPLVKKRAGSKGRS